MDEKTIKLVKESWEKVEPISEQAAELFYGRLFELNPSLKFLFKSPIPVQGKMLMKALDGAVTGLDDLESLVPVLQKLGARHSPYGVVEADYQTVGEALLWTLERGLESGFTDEVKNAWTIVYGVISEVMMEAQAKVVLSGPLSPREVRLVQGSWEQVEPIAATAATLFYDKLFELDPSLKPLFKSNINEQGKKLTQMLTVAVKGLTRLDNIVPAVQQLGVRHIDYGVKAEDYGTVGEALLYALKEGLGDDFTSEVKRAWTSVYSLLADTMKNAAAESSAARPTKAPPTPSPSKGPSEVSISVALGLSLALVVVSVIGSI